MFASIKKVINPLDRKWVNFINSLEADIIKYDINRTYLRKKELFKKNVRLVEFEPHAFCNRTCSFCPNSFIDRVNNKELMDFELFIRILLELKEINYDAGIRFSRYCESLACEKIFEYIRAVREVLPNSSLDIVSNGDYLNKAMLKELENIGIAALRISLYAEKNGEWDRDIACSRVESLAQKLGRKVFLNTSNDEYILWKLASDKINIFIETKNLFETGFDRGQSLDDLNDCDFARTSPCPFVFENFTIDYNGSVMPCCNLRSDFEEHEKYVIEKLTGKDYKSIFDVYSSRSFSHWRKLLYNVGKKVIPCSSCKQKALIGERELSAAQKKISKALLNEK